MGFSSRYTHRDGQNVVYDFADELKDIVPEVHVVGDAVRARRALDATKEAYDVALKTLIIIYRNCKKCVCDSS